MRAPRPLPNRRPRQSEHGAALDPIRRCTGQKRRREVSQVSRRDDRLALSPGLFEHEPTPRRIKLREDVVEQQDRPLAGLRPHETCPRPVWWRGPPVVAARASRRCSDRHHRPRTRSRLGAARPVRRPGRSRAATDRGLVLHTARQGLPRLGRVLTRRSRPGDTRPGGRAGCRQDRGRACPDRDSEHATISSRCAVTIEPSLTISSFQYSN